MRRHPADLLRVLVGGVVVVAGGMAAQRGRPFAFDADLLRLVNGLPAALGRPLLVVMQLGALALASCLAAFKVQLPLVSVVAVYLVAAAVAAASPLPGGLVAMEAALVVGLTAAGAPAGPAVAGVLAFRLVTFWLPILPGWLAYRSLRASGTI